MANPTTNYSFAMPTNTDLVKDLPADFEIFGQAVDTQMKTNADAAIAKTIVDAKGDIIAATAADTVARLAVGSNNTVLIADSSTATGLKWGTVAASPASASASVVTQQTTTSTSFTDLATSGPAVTLTTGTKVLVIVSSWLNNGNLGGDAECDFAVSGATTRSATDETSLYVKGDPSNTSYGLRASSATYLTVTAGSNTFTAKYRRQAGVGTASFKCRQITVIDLGS